MSNFKVYHQINPAVPRDATYENIHPLITMKYSAT